MAAAAHGGVPASELPAGAWGGHKLCMLAAGTCRHTPLLVASRARRCRHTVKCLPCTYSSNCTHTQACLRDVERLLLPASRTQQHLCKAAAALLVVTAAALGRQARAEAARWEMGTMGSGTSVDAIHSKQVKRGGHRKTTCCPTPERTAARACTPVLVAAQHASLRSRPTASLCERLDGMCWHERPHQRAPVPWQCHAQRRVHHQCDPVHPVADIAGMQPGVQPGRAVAQCVAKVLLPVWHQNQGHGPRVKARVLQQWEGAHRPRDGTVACLRCHHIMRRLQHSTAESSTVRTCRSGVGSSSPMTRAYTGGRMSLSSAWHGDGRSARQAHQQAVAFLNAP